MLRMSAIVVEWMDLDARNQRTVGTTSFIFSFLFTHVMSSLSSYIFKKDTHPTIKGIFSLFLFQQLVQGKGRVFLLDVSFI